MPSVVFSLYTIQIDFPPVNGSWYNKKLGETFEAELRPRGHGIDVAFYVGGNKMINPIHCKVISEKNIDKWNQRFVKVKIIYSNW